VPEYPIEDLEAQVGTTRTTVEGLAVEAGKVGEFARAVHDDNPAHRSTDAAREQGFDAIPAPLTFTRVAFFPRYQPDGIDESFGFDMGFDRAHLLHGEQAYEFDRPLTVGDTLTGETTLEDVSQSEGGRGGTLTFAVFRTDFYDEAGDRVLAERITRVETQGAVDGGGGGDEQGAVSGVEERGDPRTDPAPAGVRREIPPAAPEPSDLASLSVGDRGPAVTVVDVRREDFVRYAGASGDFNPVHYSEPFARNAGNPAVFGQGMFTAGVAAHFVADWLGLANVARLRTRFTSQLWPGESIAATGEVTETTVVDGQIKVTVDLAIATGDGETLLTGEATAIGD
jgi:peroxisomal enoyl-CoA hydratase 2